MVKFKVVATASAAEALARRVNAPNVVVSHVKNGSGYSPVILLRPDQTFMSQRILERGVIVGELK